MEISKLRETVQQLQTEKESWFSKKQDISTHIASAIGKIKVHKQKRDELTLSVKDLKVKRDALNSQIKDFIGEAKKSSPSKPVQTHTYAKDKKGAPITPAKLKKEIQAMQYKIETEGLTFDNEQKMMKIIKEKQKELEKMKDHKPAAPQVTLTKEQSEKIDALKKESDDIHAQIQDMAKRSQDEHEAILAISKEIDDLRVQEKEVAAKCAEIKGQYKEVSSQLATEAPSTPKPSRKKENQSSSKKNEHMKQKIDEQVAVVEQKIKDKKKLTTQDLLALQQKDDPRNSEDF